MLQYYKITKGNSMKTIHINEAVHTALRYKSINKHASIQDIANEILSQHFNLPGTQGK